MIAGPSGVGKGTVVRRVLERTPDLFVSVSATTRRPRPAEREGVDYLFVSDEEFDRMIAAGELLEWAEIFGHRSGTPVAPVRRVLEAGRDVLLEVDVQGARQVKEAEPESVLILLAPPSLEELERRLRTRGTEDEERLARRLAEGRVGAGPGIGLRPRGGERRRGSCVVAGRCYHPGVPATRRRRRPCARPGRTREPMIDPKIDDLLAQVDSKYTLVILAAKRAREINSYYNQLGEGRAEFIPPLVETGLKNKPLSIALEEIAEGKILAETAEGAGVK